MKGGDRLLYFCTFQRKGIYKEANATPSPSFKLANEAECGFCANLYGQKVVPLRYLPVRNIVYRPAFLPKQTRATAALSCIS